VRLLLVDDDDEILLFLGRALRKDGHAVDVVTDGTDAVWMAGAVSYDAILLDVNLPPPDGFEVCRRLRRAEIWSPLIFLTARAEVVDRVAGLDAGGDDYLVKPVAVEELDARLRALSRRAAPARPVRLEGGDLVVDTATRAVRRGEVAIDLTPKEFALLELLLRDRGRVVTRAKIHESLWDFAYEPESNVVDALIRRLRCRIDEPFGQSSITTVRGVGYCFEAVVSPR
jgi:two-component system, OmpR family, response regulator